MDAESVRLAMNEPWYQEAMGHARNAMRILAENGVPDGTRIHTESGTLVVGNDLPPDPEVDALLDEVERRHGVVTAPGGDADPQAPDRP